MGSNPGSAEESTPLDELFEDAYSELKGLAHRRLMMEGASMTLETTALVHEAYLRLLSASNWKWQDRHHFFAVASRAMRRILVDHARERSAAKRGGGRVRIAFRAEELAGLLAVETADPDALLALDDQLRRFEALHPRAARAIELRYFGGLTLEEVGQTVGSSGPTVLRDIRFGLAWLARELCTEGATPPGP